jgi:hypothetical protein
MRTSMMLSNGSLSGHTIGVASKAVLHSRDSSGVHPPSPKLPASSDKSEDKSEAFFHSFFGRRRKTLELLIN